MRSERGERKKSKPIVEHRLTKRALEKYGIVLQYLAYENTTFWTRSGFFLVAHAGLLAFVATNSLPTRASAPEKIIVSVVIAAIGILLGIAWLLALMAGKFWINRWHAVLLKLESDAFENIQILRGVVHTKDEVREKPRRALFAHFSGKNIIYLVAAVFTALWLALLFWSLAPSF